MSRGYWHVPRAWKLGRVDKDVLHHPFLEPEFDAFPLVIRPELVVAPCQLKVPKKTLSSALACKEYWRVVIADLILKSPTCVPSQLIWYTASTVEARTAKSPDSSGLGERSFGFSALVCFGSAGFAGGLASAGFAGAGFGSATGVCGFSSFGSAAAPSGFAGAS